MQILILLLAPETKTCDVVLEGLLTEGKKETVVSTVFQGFSEPFQFLIDQSIRMDSRYSIIPT
jgi:hypothetical protein